MDIKALGEEIDRSGMKRYKIAEMMGLTRVGLAKKISGETEFKRSEISKICDILNLDNTTRDRIFFGDSVG